MALSFVNGTSISLEAIPTCSFAAFREAFLEPAFERDRKRVLAYWRLPDGRVACVFGNPATHRLEVLAVDGTEVRPLTPEVPALHRFEAELEGRENACPFVPLKGAAAHEVAVGPVHAGVIEPGHFRFQCMGETVHSLEIALGYQHRGVERLMVETTSDIRRLALAETVAGDTSIAAALACSLVLNPGRESFFTFSPFDFSTLFLELERIANHVGDLGALAGDVAYLPTASFCGRIRGEYLNMTAELCGNRFGRGALTGCLVTDNRTAKLEKIRPWFARTKRELFHALDLLFTETSALERFEGTGTVPAAVARAIGLTGLAGRASGLAVDSRIDFPLPGEPVRESLVAAELRTGDVLSRARQRYSELLVSHHLVETILSNGMVGSVVSNDQRPTTNDYTLTVAVVEAWRGELVHLAVVGAEGKVEQYKIFDPSYHNWFGLAQALRNEQISNFPICNKSFNLSYCGVDR